MVEFKDRTELIYKAIDDTTNTLRFIDTKVASIFVVIGILTSMFIGLGDRILTVYNFYENMPVHSSIIGLSIVVYLVSIIISVIFGFKTIKAADNPNDHINNDGYEGKNLWYLLSKSDGKIAISVNEYLNEINNLDEDNFIKMISIELMKVSAIRNIKIQNINKSIDWFKVSIISILIPMLYSLLYYSLY